MLLALFKYWRVALAGGIVVLVVVVGGYVWWLRSENQALQHKAAMAVATAKMNAQAVDRIQQEMARRAKIQAGLAKDRANTRKQYEQLQADIRQMVRDSSAQVRACADVPVDDAILDRLRDGAEGQDGTDNTTH